MSKKIPTVRPTVQRTRAGMLQIEEKIENQPHSMSRKSSISFITLLILSVFLLGFRHFALSQQLPASGLDTQARSQDIVAHLNAVIQFYRASMQPIQKAGEPNDVVYRDQAVALSGQVAGFAFQSAKAEAALMNSDQSGQAASDSSGSGEEHEQQRTQTVEANVEKQIADLQTRRATLEKQIAMAKPQAMPALLAQQKELQGSLDLSNAMKDALQKIVGISDSRGGTGLAADIDRLQRSVPELQ